MRYTYGSSHNDGQCNRIYIYDTEGTLRNVGCIKQSDETSEVEFEATNGYNGASVIQDLSKFHKRKFKNSMEALDVINAG